MRYILIGIFLFASYGAMSQVCLLDALIAESTSPVDSGGSWVIFTKPPDSGLDNSDLVGDNPCITFDICDSQFQIKYTYFSTTCDCFKDNIITFNTPPKICEIVMNVEIQKPCPE